MTDMLVDAGVLLHDLEDLDDVRCEHDHVDSTCSSVVRWSAPPSPCGCHPRRLACQSTWDWFFLGDFEVECSRCAEDSPVEEWRKGWFPV